MPGEEFRFAYHMPDYERTFEFYAEGLGLEVIESWDRGVGDQGPCSAPRQGSSRA